MSFDPVTAITNLITTVVDKAIPDAGKAAEIKAQLTEKMMDGEIQLAVGQLQANIEEAKVGQNLKTDWMEFFIAAWRPAVGWAGVLGLTYNSLVLPASEFVAKVVFHYGGAFPEVNLTLLGEVLLGLLGMGALRSRDKQYEVSNGH